MAGYQRSRYGWEKLIGIAISWGVICGLAMFCAPHAVEGQVGVRVYPAPGYYLGRTALREGDYASALKLYRAAAKQGLSAFGERWIDSICYHAMIGECLYQMGDLENSLKSFDAALLQFLQNPTWMQAVKFGPQVSANTRNLKAGLPWGPGTRAFPRANLPDTIPIFMGDLDASNEVAQGGVVRPAQLRMADVREVAYCTSLAIRRRMDILGPLCPQMPLTRQLMTVYEGRIGLANHWSTAWIDSQKGLAEAAMGQHDKAFNSLSSNLVMSGQFDHNLTATNLLELGKIAFRQDRFDMAVGLLLEATLSAAADEDSIVLNDAFSWLAAAFKANNNPEPIVALTKAMEWSHRCGFRTTKATRAILAAESATRLGTPEAARPFLSQFQAALGRRANGSPYLLSEFQYQSAVTDALLRQEKNVSRALTAAVVTRQKCSPMLFQIAQTDQLFTSNAFSDRIADQMYDELLKLPSATDRLRRPVDTLTFEVTPLDASLGLWLEANLLMRNSAEAIAIADRMRQHRFTSQLPHGGQVLALRWVLEMDDKSLSPEAKLRRQELLNRYPQYHTISTQAREQRDRLRAIQPADVDANSITQQAEEANKLQDLGNEQERLLRELAFRGEHAPLEFPPRLNLSTMQNELADKTIVLSFISTPRSLYAMMFTKDQSKFAVWSIGNPRSVPGDIATLLRAMNIRDGKLQFTLTELRDEQWKEPAKKLLANLIDPQQVGFWKNFEELVVVPEGPLWHLPFEVLQIPDGDSTVSLGSRMRVRYVPAISLAVPGLLQRGRQPATVVEAGRLVRGEIRTFSDAEIEDWKRFVPQLTLLPDKLPGSISVLKTRWDRLVVFDEIPEVREPFAFAPLPRAGNRAENQLLGWMSSPWGGPYTVILPGAVTSAASGLKQAKDGPELATVTLGLMAAGTRSVLISRWPSGGQTSYDLVREYVREIDHGSSAKAWQRAVVLTREQEIDPSREPRVRTSSEDSELIKADHPFFWAGYMLVDTGFEAQQN